MTTSTSTPRPERVGEYLVLGTLSDGPTTLVSTALRVGDPTGTLFALKRPRLGQRPSGRAAQAIVREAEVLRVLSEREHGAQGFARLDRAGSLGGLPFLATELASGASLERVLAGGKLAKSALFPLAAALAGALSRLHEAGYVHGDVCPRNVLVTDAGEVVLLDLGLAARVGEERDAAVGTAGYVPPEGARPTKADPSHDVYSLAVVLAEAHLGRRLFPERELAEAASRETPTRDALPRSPLGAWLERSLARDPRARPPLDELVALASRDEAARDVAALAERARLAALGEAPPPEALEPSDVDGERDTVYDPALAGGVTSPEQPSPLAFAPPIASPIAPPIASPASTPARLEARAGLEPRPSAQGRMAREEPPPPRLEPRDPAGRKKPLRASWLLMGPIILVSVLAGTFVGRATARRREATTLSLGAALPARVTAELDGRAMAAGVDRPETISPGKHSLVLTLRNEKREIAFVARPGEHVVLVPLLRGVGVD